MEQVGLEVLRYSSSLQPASVSGVRTELLFQPLTAHPGHGRKPYKHFHTHYFTVEMDSAHFLL